MIIQKKLIKPIENKGAVKIPLSSKEHSTTTNRDAPNQHPQEAITGLTSDLNTIRTDIVDNSASVSSVKSEITKLQVEIDAKPDKLFVETQLANKANKTEIDTIDAALEVQSTNISDNTANILLKANETELVNKQDKLTAGANIDITDNVISSTGGGGSGDVTLDTAQNITGIKTFTNGIKNNLVEVDGKSLIIKNSNTAASYLEVESVYSGSGYKNWFGIQLFRTTGTSRSRLANLEIRQDDGLYIACANDVSIQGSNIKFNNVRLQQVGTPTADYDAATKKYADDGLSLKVDKTEIAAIDAAIELNTNNITKNADDILLKANETEITAIDAKLVINTNNITKNADDILLKADKTEITALDTKLTLNTNDISDNTADILLKADKTELVNKQDKLTAGTNISIVGDVISSTGGAAGVTLDTAQTITGIKTFENGMKNNFVEVDGKSLIIKNSNTAASYLEVESVYSGSGYKNWFGIQLFRTTGASRSKLANLEIRQDDGLYIACVNDVSIQGSNIKFNNVRLQQVGAPTANTDAANKEYVDGKTLTNVDTLIKSATTTIPSLTTAGDSTQTITSIFDAATWDLIKASNQYYLLAYTSARASRTGFPIVIKMEYAMTSDDYNIHSGAGDFTFFNYTDFATTYAIKVMVALSRDNGSFRFAVKFDGTLNSNFNINRIEIWKKGVV